MKKLILAIALGIMTMACNCKTGNKHKIISTNSTANSIQTESATHNSEQQQFAPEKL